MGSITTDTARAGAEKVVLITESAREQQHGSELMVKAIGEISRLAGENARSTEQVQKAMEDQTRAVTQMTRAAQDLTNLSVELQSVVRRFRLGRLPPAQAHLSTSAQHRGCLEWEPASPP